MRATSTSTNLLRRKISGAILQSENLVYNTSGAKTLVGEETLSVQAGATVVVLKGANRGIEAETQLAFLAVRLSQ